MVYFAENCSPLGLSAFVSFHASRRSENLSKGFAAALRKKGANLSFNSETGTSKQLKCEFDEAKILQLLQILKNRNTQECTKECFIIYLQ